MPNDSIDKYYSWDDIPSSFDLTTETFFGFVFGFMTSFFTMIAMALIAPWLELPLGVPAYLLVAYYWVKNTVFRRASIRIKDCEAPLTTNGRLSIFFASIFNPILGLKLVTTWAWRKIHRRRVNPFYSQIYETRKIIKRLRKLPDSSRTKAALNEAQRTLDYFIELELNQLDNYSDLDRIRAREIRESTQLDIAMLNKAREEAERASDPLKVMTSRN